MAGSYLVKILFATEIKAAALSVWRYIPLGVDSVNKQQQQ